MAGLLGSDRDELGAALAAEREVTAQALAGVERAVAALAEPRRDPDLLAALDRLAAEPRHDPALLAAVERVAEGQARLATLAEVPSPPAFDPSALDTVLDRLADGQARLVTLAEAPAPAADNSRLVRALERLAEGQDRILELGAQRPTAGDDPEARMRLRSIDVQLGRLVEETASNRDGLIAELRSDLAALTRAIRNMERGDGA